MTARSFSVTPASYVEFAPARQARAHRPGKGRSMSKSAQNLSTRVLILLLALTSIFLLLGNIGAADEPQVVGSHVVQPGDTLWSIAEGIAEPGSDIREVVSDLKTLNAMPTSSLQIGQALLIPAG